jgi:hypothetical protein
MVELGEQVDTTEKTIEKFDSEWKLTIEVYHPDNSLRYNLYGELKEKVGLFEKPDEWSLTHCNVDKDELDEKIEALSSKLLKAASQRFEARKIDVNVDVEKD